MRRRLFWKLLAGSWITLAVVGVGNGVLFHAVATQVVPFTQQVVARYEDLELAAAAYVLRAEGPQAIADFVSQLPPGTTVQVSPGRNTLTNESGFQRSQMVKTSSGEFTLVADGTPYLAVPALVRQVPANLLLMDFLALSVFSVVIAAYLAGPIRRLSTGMARVAEGDFNVRVAENLGTRRDEMADLAHTFDDMAQRLQQLVKAREQLLHDVSHEFRSPLTRIRLAAEIARKSPDSWPRCLERIVYDAERLSGMVDELLTLARAQFAVSKSETYFDLAALLSEIVADVRFEAEAADITLTVSIPETLRDNDQLVLNGNPELLRKAIENVLRNAVEYSPRGECVALSLSRPTGRHDSLQIDVSDRGPGVPADSLVRIFEPFERVGDLKSSGFGLGLAIARSAVTAHQGSIVATNRPSGGLIVTLRLPQATSQLA